MNNFYEKKSSFLFIFCPIQFGKEPHRRKNGPESDPKFPKLDEVAEDLLIAADKYQLDQLKSLCVGNLCKNIVFRENTPACHRQFSWTAGTIYTQFFLQAFFL